MNEQTRSATAAAAVAVAETVADVARRAAEEAGLRYVDCAGAGVRRVRRGRHVGYVDAEGLPVRDEPTLARIRALAIPPAWRDVWICTDARGHLQATGRDARGRKQYRYHAQWRTSRDETKFHRLLAFGEALPALRARVDADMRRSSLDRERIVATVVRMLDRTHVRVGNDEYARANRSYGLTTLRAGHVDRSGDRVRLHFRGKSGREHDLVVSDARVARVVARCQELPGQLLFQYVGGDGEAHPVRSDDVNHYLGDFSAKDFRTWAGTVTALRCLRAADSDTTARERQRVLRETFETVAADLGNTVAVARRSYVDPRVVDEFTATGAVQLPPRRRVPRGLSTDEADLVAWLRRQERGSPRRRRAVPD